MKIFQNSRISSTQKICFLGIPIIKTVYGKNRQKTKYFFGFFQIIKDEDIPNFQTVIKYYILGILLYKRRTINLYTLSNIMDTYQKKINNTIVSCIKRETRVSLETKKAHEKAFSQFRNVNKENDIVLVGTGPTLNEYSPNPNMIHIGMNRAYESGIDFKYYFFAFTIANMI